MIETHDLTRYYGPIKAVDGISFSVAPGEVLGFLGPNGAGKSTTMKMIAGFVEPTAGTATVFGHDVVKEPVVCKSRIGYLPEGAPSYGEMTPRGFLNFIADIRRLSGERRKARLDTVIEQLHLGPVLGQSIETLSKGFKRRVGLAQAILHDPDVLILDEPTDGLDPNQKHEVRQLIREMAEDKIIVISTHILEEVSAVCTRAIIIARGKLLADETPQALQARAPGHNRIVIEPASAEALTALRAAIGAMDKVAKVHQHEGALIVDPKDGRNLFNDIATLAVNQHHDIRDMQINHGQLDDVFRDITVGDMAAERS